MSARSKKRSAYLPVPKVEDAMECGVCLHHDRSLIERLMAHGTYLYDISAEYGISERILKKHDAIHSTCIPSIDPETVLRHMRWLTERTYFTTRYALGEHRDEGVKPEPRPATLNARIACIKVNLAVITELASICNIRKHIDPYIVQPRWENTMKKLAFKLKDNPQALRVLSSFMEEEGPAETQEQMRKREENKDGIAATAEDLTVDVEAKAFALERENEELKKRVENLGTFIPEKDFGKCDLCGVVFVSSLDSDNHGCPRKSSWDIINQPTEEEKEAP